MGVSEVRSHTHVASPTLIQVFFCSAIVNIGESSRTPVRSFVSTPDWFEAPQEGLLSPAPGQNTSHPTPFHCHCLDHHVGILVPWLSEALPLTQEGTRMKDYIGTASYSEPLLPLSPAPSLAWHPVFLSITKQENHSAVRYFLYHRLLPPPRE